MMDKNFTFPFSKLSDFMCRSQNLRKFNLFNIDSRRRKFPSARCASAAKGVSGDMDVFFYLTILKLIVINDVIKICCVAVFLFLLYFIVSYFLYL
jgi:hypothetical protein